MNIRLCLLIILLVPCYHNFANAQNTACPPNDPCDTNCDGIRPPGNTPAHTLDLVTFNQLVAGAAQCSDCAGDINGDGQVNAQDVAGFIACGLIDCNGNGIHDGTELGGRGASDMDGNLIIDSCQFDGDMTSDFIIDGLDIGPAIESFVSGIFDFRLDFDDDFDNDTSDIAAFVDALLTA